MAPLTTGRVVIAVAAVYQSKVGYFNLTSLTSHTQSSDVKESCFHVFLLSC
ncbi:hypothetical protein Mapa_011483 [Marchantia paleacea]|nr:hypothetical protein Mapa_011483 [Marchantia paleacea]